MTATRRSASSAAPAQAQAAGRHVDPARFHALLLRQHRFNQPDAGAALQPVDRQRQLMSAIRPRYDVPSQIPALRRLGPQRAGADRLQSLLVINPDYG
jgi:hypothetical protein